MIWLGLGVALMLWAAFTGRRALDPLAILAAACAMAAALASPRTYLPVDCALVVALGAAAALALRFLVASAPLRYRALALVIGAGASLFGLVGPADGLF